MFFFQMLKLKGSYVPNLVKNGARSLVRSCRTDTGRTCSSVFVIFCSVLYIALDRQFVCLKIVEIFFTFVYEIILTVFAA